MNTFFNLRRHPQLTAFLFCMAIFGAMQAFFVVLHPIVIMDLDDVLYTVFSRPAIPIPGFWNPSRVFPEVLMPLCGNLAGFLTALGFGSFIHCQVFVFGTVYSLFIAGYVNALRKLLEKRFGLPFFTSSCLALLFLMLHFVAFRSEDSGNLHMFHTYDACCLFFYTIPALLCCTLVMFFMTESEPEKLFSRGLFKSSILLLSLYLAVFSNLYGSIILAAYAGCRALQDLIKPKTTPVSFRNWFREDLLWLLILLFWFLSLILEAFGGRAASVASSSSLAEKLSASWTWFFFPLSKFSLFFRLLLLIVPLCALLFILIRPDREINRLFLASVGSIVVLSVFTFLYLFFLAAFSNPIYAGRVEAIFPFFFTVFLLLILCLQLLLKRIPQASSLLPIGLLFIYTMINTQLLTFADSNPLELDGSLALRIQDEIYERVRLAAEEGAEEVIVPVPQSEDYPTNWPHNQWVGDPIAEFLLKYGVIDHHIKVIIEPSEEYNQSHHITLQGKVLK